MQRFQFFVDDLVSRLLQRESLECNQIADLARNAEAWDKSADAFRKDLQALCDLVSDESTDLFARIPHGDGQTILREALVTADHNSYHLGEFVLLRRILGAWQ